MPKRYVFILGEYYAINHNEIDFLKGEHRLKIAFVTTFCPFYRVKTFEDLSDFHNIKFFFFSKGDERYWQQEHGVRFGRFQYENLPGFRLLGTQISPTLPSKLWQGNYDLYIKCINGRFALPITYLFARLKRKPFILWTGVWMRLQTPFHRMFFPLTRYFYRNADAIVTYGSHVKRYLISEGVRADKIFLAHHAVDNNQLSIPVPKEEQTKLRQEFELDDNHRTVLFLGRLEEEKGLSHLIKAFSETTFPNSRLIIVGVGSERSKLNALVSELSISDRVHFEGYVPHENIRSYYSISSVLVLPSITTPYSKETWGLVVNEAFNQGLPVIVSDAVGAAAGGLVQDNVNGFVVPEGDTEALSQSIQKVLENDALRQQFSNAARKKISTWNNEQMVKGFLQAIDYVSKRY